MSKTTKPRRLKDTRPTSGKGSRQPVIKLPTLMPDGSKTTKHPLVWLMANRLPDDANKSTVAAALGVRPQSLYKWEAAAEADRNFPVPILRARQLAAFFSVSPELLRPDAY
jgi:DNA-binding XRE family transcriptional regulator